MPEMLIKFIPEVGQVVNETSLAHEIDRFSSDPVTDVSVTETANGLRLHLHHVSGGRHVSIWTHRKALIAWLHHRPQLRELPCHFCGRDGVLGESFP